MSPALTLFVAPVSAELLIASVVATLSSPKTKRAYEAALREFWAWTAERGEPLSKPLLETWRSALSARGLSVSSVNQKLSAVRLLLRQAAERGALPWEQATRLASVGNLKQSGTRHGKWLTEKEAGRLLGAPDPATRIGVRDRAILALLLACGLRRDELVRLRVRHLQLRDDRWVLLDLLGKGGRTRTVAIPHWVRRLLDDWLLRGGVQTGTLFRTVRKGGRKTGPDQPLSEDAIYTLVMSKSRRGIGADPVFIGPCFYPDHRTLSRKQAGPRAGRQRPSQNQAGSRLMGNWN
jgi:integrase